MQKKKMNLVPRKSNESIIISYIRVMATILILLCHIVPIYSDPRIQSLAQIFNVGVTIFLLISGYLYGSRSIRSEQKYSKWIVNRVRKVLLPYYMFLILLFGIYLVKGIPIQPFNWIINVLNLQGFEVYVNGAEHLWYLTVAFLCYISTIVLDKNREKMNSRFVVLLFALLILLQCLVSKVYVQGARYIIYITIYIVGYMLSRFDILSYLSSRVLLDISILGIISGMGLRVVGRVLFDETIIYNVFIVMYTQLMLGVGIFGVWMWIGKHVRLSEKIRHLDSISYEVYLVHYMLIVGPISLVSVIENKGINSALIVGVAIVVAIILHWLVGSVQAGFTSKSKGG